VIGPDFPEGRVVKYGAVRSDLRDMDYLLCSGNAAFSKLIQLGTGAVWSHVARLIWVPKFDNLMVFESVESIGVRLVPLSSYMRDYSGTGEPYPGGLLVGRHPDYDLSDAYPDRMERAGRFIGKHQGRPYDGAEIGRIAWRIAAAVMGVEPDLVRDDTFICSEASTELDAEYGLDLSDLWDGRGFVSPANIAMWEPIDQVCILRPKDGG